MIVGLLMHGEKQRIGTTLNKFKSISMSHVTDIIASYFQEYIAGIDFAVGRRVGHDLTSEMNVILSLSLPLASRKRCVETTAMYQPCFSPSW